MMIHNIAHRGASAYEPENTLRAFERAIEMGASMLELDVHLSRNGHPIVVHDADLSRTTDGVGQVHDLTLEQIKRLDAGQGERIPTLSEVIDLTRERVELYIELKGPDTPAPVLGALREMDFANRAIIGCFIPQLLQEVKRLDPKVRTSLLIRSQDRTANFAEWATAIKVDYVHPCWERASPTPHRLLTPAVIANVRRHGLGLIVWHEERSTELRQLVKLNIDGICTNKPDLLASILRGEES